MDEIITAAMSLTRDQFVAAYRDLYLIVIGNVETEEIEFRTFTGPMRALPARQQPAELEVRPLAKAPGNPYSEVISVGRTRNCDIHLRDVSISKFHAHFRKTAEHELTVADAGSKNGTLLNGRPLRARTPEAARPGDLVQFGRVRALIADAEGILAHLARR